VEAVLAISIGILFGSGVWLTGLLMLSYAVNMFIFVMGRAKINQAPITLTEDIDPALYADPLPQALVLTAIVIGFASTALYLVVLLASRGLTGTDHVDGKESTE
jgi:multicomponent K+:H+ antiporter subunit C